jgi:TPR repeat protein
LHRALTETGADGERQGARFAAAIFGIFVVHQERPRLTSQLGARDGPAPLPATHGTQPGMRHGDDAPTLEGTFELGVCYYTGEGMPQDHREAARMFRLAADQGHDEAQLYYGVCCARGEGVSQNPSEAARYYRLAADQGYDNAQFNLAVCYNNGRGVHQNHETAARYYRLAADQGHAEAQFRLALYYARGEGGPQDFNQTAVYLRLAADQGHANAQHGLGECYYMAQGVPGDLSEAARYYRLAADQQFPAAQLALGRMLIMGVGEGVPTDPRAGAKLLARVVQCEGAEYEQLRPNALELLRFYADRREVVAACCIGCGASRGLKTCERCHVARFCGSACMRKMWPTHKRCCKEWVAQGGPSQ